MKKEELLGIVANMNIEKTIPYYRNENGQGLFTKDYNNYFTSLGGIDILELRERFTFATHYAKIALLIEENNYYLPGVIAFISFCNNNNIELFIIYKDEDEYSIQPIKSKYWYSMFNCG